MVTSIILAFEYIGLSTAVATFAANFALSYVVTRVFGSNTSNQPVDNGVRLQVPPSVPFLYSGSTHHKSSFNSFIFGDQMLELL